MFTGTLNLCLSCLENIYGFSGESDGKESACIVGDSSSIPRSGRSPGEGNGNPLQYSCLENPMNRGALWWLQSLGSHLVTTERLTHVNNNSKQL